MTGEMQTRRKREEAKNVEKEEEKGEQKAEADETRDVAHYFVSSSFSFASVSSFYFALFSSFLFYIQLQSGKHIFPVRYS